MYKKFIVAKPLATKYGNLPVGTELMVVDNAIFVNNLMIEPWFYECFHFIIDGEMKKPNYLKQVAIRNNKFK